MPKKKQGNYGACCGTIIGNQAKRIKELEKELRETKDELRKANRRIGELEKELRRMYAHSSQTHGALHYAVNALKYIRDMRNDDRRSPAGIAFETMKVIEKTMAPPEPILEVVA
jgi:predicted RNase H-like nuclease (RuvC/YqgF family)